MFLSLVAAVFGALVVTAQDSSHIPLTCYSCNSPLAPDSCRATTQCNPFEFCALTPTINATTNVVRVHAHCAARHECTVMSDRFNATAVVGRKRGQNQLKLRWQRGTSCCNSDMCNAVVADNYRWLLPYDCSLYKNISNGVYPILPPYSTNIVQAYCENDDGIPWTNNSRPWTVFHRRFTGNLDFNRTFSEYENGFGDIHAEFWLGLKVMQEMTHNGQGIEIRIRLNSTNGNSSQYWSGVYPNVLVSLNTYKTNVDDGVGDLYSYDPEFGPDVDRGTPLRPFAPTIAFSTKDHGPEADCANTLGGGWWYLNCLKLYPGAILPWSFTASNDTTGLRSFAFLGGKVTYNEIAIRHAPYTRVIV